LPSCSRWLHRPCPQACELQRSASQVPSLVRTCRKETRTWECLRELCLLGRTTVCISPLAARGTG
jgi:hypothetical protein